MKTWYCAILVYSMFLFSLHQTPLFIYWQHYVIELSIAMMNWWFEHFSSQHSDIVSKLSLMLWQNTETNEVEQCFAEMFQTLWHVRCKPLFLSPYSVLSAVSAVTSVNPLGRLRSAKGIGTVPVNIVPQLWHSLTPQWDLFISFDPFCSVSKGHRQSP